jgi:papain like cysteine protease AvrRpt2
MAFVFGGRPKVERRTASAFRARAVAWLLLVAAVPRPVAAQPVLQTTGIPSAEFEHFFSEQRNSQWCWAAGIQMILNYYGIEISQEDIVRRSYRGTNPFGPLPNWPGSLPVITANLNNWGVDSKGRRYQVTAQFTAGAPAPAVLKNELENKRPVLIGYMSGSGGGHAVVGTAVSYIDTPIGPDVEAITVRDPWPSQENRARGGKVTHPAAAFAGVMQNVWVIQVRKLPIIAEQELPDSNSTVDRGDDDRAPVPSAEVVLSELRTARQPPPADADGKKLYDELITILESAARGEFDSMKGELRGHSTERWTSTLSPTSLGLCVITESSLNDDLWHQFGCERPATDQRGNEVFAQTRGVLRRLLPSSWTGKRTARTYIAQRGDDHGPVVVLNYVPDGGVRLTVTARY